MKTAMQFTRRVDTTLGYDDAIIAVKTALQEQGFGTLTEIDVAATLKAKLDVDTAPQLIIGACNPQLAHRAMSVDARVATLLPCNVVVRATDGGSVVEALDPQVMAVVTGAPALTDIADDAARRVQAALDALPRR
jgi:uncharacterized protein (DUF302 family)